MAPNTTMTMRPGVGVAGDAAGAARVWCRRVRRASELAKLSTKEVQRCGLPEAFTAEVMAEVGKLEDKDGDVRKAAVKALATRGDPHAALSRRRRHARG